MLYRLIYVSTASKPITYDKIKPICEVAARNNKSAGLTGILIFNRKYFAQMVEGSREEVSKMFMRIACNPTHHNVEMIEFRPITSRMFTYYGVKMFAEDEKGSRIFFRYTSEREFNPYHMTTDNAAPMIAEISGLVSEDMQEIEAKVINIYEAS